MKTLVTGGAGFIGSHLAQALTRQGAHVTILDNLSLGSRANLSWIKPTDSVEFVEGDLLDAALVRRLIAGCDWVFHQGALPSVPRSVQAPVESNRQNVDGTLQMLVAARDAGVKRFLFASSSSIYGDVDAAFTREDLAPNPVSPYALQKYTGERYCQIFYRLYGLPAVALRYFNVFGPRQRADSPYSGVIAKFCTSVLVGQAPKINGNGKQSRDFTYVDNAVEANLRAATAPAEMVAGQFFNIACGSSVSLLQLVADLCELTGQDFTPQFGPPRAGDVMHSKADISAAHKAFGYSPSVLWKDGLARTLAWYRESLKL